MSRQMIRTISPQFALSCPTQNSGTLSLWRVGDPCGSSFLSLVCWSHSTVKFIRGISSSCRRQLITPPRPGTVQRQLELYGWVMWDVPHHVSPAVWAHVTPVPRSSTVRFQGHPTTREYINSCPVRESWETLYLEVVHARPTGIPSLVPPATQAASSWCPTVDSCF